MSFFAQQSSGDLDLSTGNLAVVTDENMQVAQKLTNRFRLFQGEWFADSRVGTPYYTYVLVKNPSLAIISQVFRRVITQTPGVAAILKETISLDARSRVLTASYQVQTIAGAILAGGVGEPFIVVVGSTTKQ